MEKSLQVEKDFCRLKDKDPNEYSDELCKYYMEGFDLLMKWMAKHHHGLDLSGLVMGDIEKELMSDRPSETMLRSKKTTVPKPKEISARGPQKKEKR